MEIWVVYNNEKEIQGVFDTEQKCKIALKAFAEMNGQMWNFETFRMNRLCLS